MLRLVTSVSAHFCQLGEAQVAYTVPPGFCDSAQAEFFAESGKMHRIWKYAQNLAENVFGLPTT